MTEQEIDQLRAGALPPREVAALGQHMTSCATCASRLSEALALSPMLDDVRTQMQADVESHLDEDEMMSYVDGTLPSERRDAARMHIDECDLCLQEVADLRVTRETLKRPRPFLLAIAASLAAVAVLGVFMVARDGKEMDQQPATTRPPVLTSVESPPPPVTPANTSKYGRKDWDGVVESAFRSARLEMPAVLTALRPQVATLRGETDVDDLSLQPGGVVIEEPRPRFQWRPIEGVQYRVILALDDSRILESDLLSQPHWEPPTDLKRGEEYAWQVEVIRGNERTVYPRSPMPAARFRILDTEAAAEIDEARRLFPDDHVLHAVLLARSGVAHEAEHQLVVARKQGDRRNVDALLRSLQSWPAVSK